MRLTEFMIVIVAALMFLIPTMQKERQQNYFEREAQEEEPYGEMEEAENRYKVQFQVEKPSEEAMADIIWMKKAADVARDAGVPYFNVVRQNITKRFVKQYKQELSIVEGVIELDNDPMRAEYDANEIESLVLTE